MKLIFTHDNALIVQNAKNLLENEGLNPSLKNEFASGGVGELSAINTWPELWVSDSEYAQAKQIIDQLLEPEHGAQWQCAQCGELNEPSFDFCWQCETEKSRS